MIGTSSLFIFYHAAAAAHYPLDGLWCYLPALPWLALVVSGTAAPSSPHDTPTSAHNHCASCLTACASLLAFVCITPTPPGVRTRALPIYTVKLHCCIRGHIGTRGAQPFISSGSPPIRKHRTGAKVGRALQKAAQPQRPSPLLLAHFLSTTAMRRCHPRSVAQGSAHRSALAPRASRRSVALTPRRGTSRCAFVPDEPPRALARLTSPRNVLVFSLPSRDLAHAPPARLLGHLVNPIPTATRRGRFSFLTASLDEQVTVIFLLIALLVLVTGTG